jgi:hypothetical protein
LQTYLAQSIKLSVDKQQQLLDGRPVTKLLDSDQSKEVAVFGAIWIGAPRASYVAALTDIENFERGGGFRLTKRISDPPCLEDFARLRLPADDVRDLRKCRVGACEVKLGALALQRFQTEIDWNAPDAAAAVNALMRQFGLEYVQGYLEGGNERLAVYRDSSRPMFVAEEFRQMVDTMPELTSYMPHVRRYLLDYPKVDLPDSTSFLYWQETEFGLKPTIRISHLTIRDGENETIVASKMLYATHYFWTGLELRVLLPDPSRGQGFWLVTVNRSRSDGLSGFKGAFVRRRVRGETEKGTLAALQATRHMLMREPSGRARSGGAPTRLRVNALERGYRVADAESSRPGVPHPCLRWRQ